MGRFLVDEEGDTTTKAVWGGARHLEAWVEAKDVLVGPTLHLMDAATPPM